MYSQCVDLHWAEGAVSSSGDGVCRVEKSVGRAREGGRVSSERAALLRQRGRVETGVGVTSEGEGRGVKQQALHGLSPNTAGAAARAASGAP